MARGYQGAFGRKINAPYVWIPLCLLFLVPFVDPRRPFRMVHLDLLVLLALRRLAHLLQPRRRSASSVPLVYPVLAYLLVRMLWLGVPAAGPAAGRCCRSSGELARGPARVPGRRSGSG